ncbi:MAG: hypothetical protein JSV23_04565 [Promethearchaeota archaeon]|nr:MAG: hypothetical protein JSV23_04565 [Candidatus Lokiarchaeota archaeon]
MIICQNCGTTNNEAVSNTCRTCGALLPVSSRPTRIKDHRIAKEKKKKRKAIEQALVESTEQEKTIEEKLDLQEISKETVITHNGTDLQEIPVPSDDIFEDETPQESEPKTNEGDLEVLQEITPQPYKGSIIDSRKSIKPLISPLPPRTKDMISNAFTELKNSVFKDQKTKPEIQTPSIPLETTESDDSILRQKRLEKDMAEVLGFLSNKISIKKLEISKIKLKEKKEPEKKIPPSSMNEILKRLITLDLNIEASAIIKTDGSILASAISSRISDSLFATIGMNLSMIGTDIIEGLSAGTLKAISVKGTEGNLDLAPIDKENPNIKDMILIIYSHTKTKSGIISFAVNIVKKQIKEYLGLEK